MGLCQIDGCEKLKIARGWCHTHYKRWQVHGDPLVTEKPRGRMCSIDGCDKKHSSIGYCSTHERRFRRYGRTTTYLNKYDSWLSAYEAQVIKNKDECWGWTGSVNNKGYPQLFFEGKILFAHRFAFLYFKEEIKPGYQVCHSCDHPVCTRPEHLFQGTQKDNIQDCIRKDRFKRAPDESKSRGEKSPLSKLKEQEVNEIKKLLAQGRTNTEIARLFGVTHGNISCIKLGQTWKHVEI